MDVSFQVNTSLLTEALILKEPKDTERLILKISCDGLKPVYKEDGSILFMNEEEKEILEILPPFMEDATGATCEDLHYELIETETGYELHKVIDENGLKWLETAVYPVVIDPSMQTFEDAWESSGLTPYGQYFQNLREFVNPATGYLTIMQTDLVISGRGLDLTISRVHQTPAVFYGIEPYDYEAPPVNIGKGWQLDFPYIGDKYLHLWGGTVYKIEWDGNQFINHVGAHFTLIKNGDNTYTLTSKVVTTTGLMVLVERGLVDLDQPANTYLGEAQLHVYEGESSEATVERILHHTAGLPMYWDHFYEYEPYESPCIDETADDTASALGVDQDSCYHCPIR